jgi:pyruvate carboxylase
LRGVKPRHGRPGAQLPPADLKETERILTGKVGREVTPDEVLSYLMYPQVFVKFAGAQQNYGDLKVLPTPQFFYGMKTGEEIWLDIEPGKTLIVKFLTVGDSRPDGYRTVFFELNGQPREVNIRDKSLRAAEAQRAKADPAKPGQVGAPIPGLVSNLAVELNETVNKGDRLLVMEAMKMQTTLYAPVGGTVKQILAQAGHQVEAKDLLLVIE